MSSSIRQIIIGLLPSAVVQYTRKLLALCGNIYWPIYSRIYFFARNGLFSVKNNIKVSIRKKVYRPIVNAISKLRKFISKPRPAFNYLLENRDILQEGLTYSLADKEHLPELKHLAMSLPSIAVDYLLNNVAEKKIKSNELKGKIWLIVALPKSASTVITSMITILAKEKGLYTKKELEYNLYKNQYLPLGSMKYADYMLANEDSNLRPEIIKSYIRGGVVKYHPWPKGNNLKIIEDLGLKVILTLRHPADQIVAYMEHARKYLKRSNIPSTGLLLKDHIYCLQESEIQQGHEESISVLINQGYLLSTLMFTTEWLRHRSHYNISVLTFEEMITNKNSFYAKLEQIAEINMNKQTRSILDLIAEDYKKRALDYKKRALNVDDTKIAYEKGWTGKVGIWREYFTEKNITEYNHYINNVRNVLDLSGIESFYKLDLS